MKKRVSPPTHPYPHTPILLLLAVLLTSCGHATEPPPSDQPLSVNLSLSTNTIRIGDTAHVRLTVDHPASATPALPDVGRGKELVVKDRHHSTHELSADRARTIVDYEVTSFRTGDHVVVTGEVVCALAGEDVGVPLPVEVLTVVTMLSDAETPMRDIKDTVAWPGIIPRWTWGFLLIAALAAIAGLVIARVLSKPRTILHEAPPTPPHIVALRALQALIRKGWVESGEVQPFYVELSSIVRHYIEERFHLRAPERTTEEFIREAASSRLLSAEHQHVTRYFLEQSDLVKFARHQPATDDMKAAYSAAERLVRETMPEAEGENDKEQSS